MIRASAATSVISLAALRSIPPTLEPCRRDGFARTGHLAVRGTGPNGLEPDAGGVCRSGGPGGETELVQDVRHVPVHRVLAQHQPLGDLPVRQSLREECEHLALTRRDLAGGWVARNGTELLQRVRRRSCLAVGQFAAAECRKRRRELGSCLRGLVRRPAARVAVDGVLEQRPRALVLAERNCQPALGEVG